MGVCQSGTAGPGPKELRPALPLKKMAGGRQPAIFVNHGGGPMPVIGDGGRGGGPDSVMVKHIAQLEAELPERPKAVLVVTAHWEEASPCITGGERPELIYDYYGFPPEGYAPHLTYSPPGAPEVANRAKQLLDEAGFKGAKVVNRGYDHGTFIPMKVAFPKEDVPMTQMSLLKSLEPGEHLALGRALAPLRDEGVLIVGSGMSFHNMQGFQKKSGDALAFDGWLREACVSEGGEGAGYERLQQLANWAKAPGARYAHPREEHLLPLLVCAGAGGDDACVANLQTEVFSIPVTGFRFG